MHILLKLQQIHDVGRDCPIMKADIATLLEGSMNGGIEKLSPLCLHHDTPVGYPQTSRSLEGCPVQLECDIGRSARLNYNHRTKLLKLPRVKKCHRDFRMPELAVGNEWRQMPTGADHAQRPDADVTVKRAENAALVVELAVVVGVVLLAEDLLLNSQCGLTLSTLDQSHLNVGHLDSFPLNVSESICAQSAFG